MIDLIDRAYSYSDVRWHRYRRPVGRDEGITTAKDLYDGASLESTIYVDGPLGEGYHDPFIDIDDPFSVFVASQLVGPVETFQSQHYSEASVRSD